MTKGEFFRLHPALLVLAFSLAVSFFVATDTLSFLTRLTAHAASSRTEWDRPRTPKTGPAARSAVVPTAKAAPLRVAVVPAEKAAPVASRSQNTQKPVATLPKAATGRQGVLPTPYPARNRNLPKAEAEGFTANVFGQPSLPPPVDPDIQRKMDHVAGRRQGNGTGKMLENAPVTLSGSTSPQPDVSSLEPRRRTFPGQYHTMSQIDEYSPPEAHVNYRIDHDTSARLAINQQDQRSPTYTPLRQDPTVNSAGVYLDMDMEKDIMLRVGGEVRSHETESHSSEKRDSTSASVGLEWQF